MTGASLVAVSKQLGQASTTVASIYGRMQQQDVRDATTRAWSAFAAMTNPQPKAEVNNG